MPVKTKDAKAMTRRLTREEGPFAGQSSGANVIAAIRAGEKLGADANIVTFMVDSGLKHLIPIFIRDSYSTINELLLLDPV